MGSTRIAVPALAVVTLLAVALCAGCGSSPKPLTRAQLVEKANSICRRVATKIEATSKGEKTNTAQQLARLAGKLAGFEQSALGELSKLTPPAALETDWKRFLGGAQSLAEDTATLSETVTAKDKAAANRAVTSAETTQKQMAAIAKRNGIKDCERVP
ncbi:MAG TPA: hypothetical protein VFW38_12715 [Solirubrobacteraceae bacterium]|nr:hypothetical protein [Solirubrobacteraceae bacterium]